MRAIFGQFGTILDVVSRRTYRLRGQAWVVFEKAEDAKTAMETMQGFPFFGKPIVSGQRRACRRREAGLGWQQASCPPAHPGWLQRVSLSKTKSDAVAKLDGTFVERAKAERQEKNKAATGGCGGGPAGRELGREGSRRRL